MSAALVQAAGLSCVEYGVATIEVKVFDEDGALIAQGGPWECSRHEGIVGGVKPGFNRSVQVLLRDSNHAVIYEGVKAGLTVRAGQITDTGSIEINAEEEFEPAQAVTDSIAMNCGGTAVILDSGYTSLLHNDAGDGITINTTPVEEPRYGTVTLYADGTFSYTHDGSENTGDSFTYEIRDRKDGTSTAVVNITALCNSNQPPRLENGTVSPDTGSETTTFTFSVRYIDDDGDIPSVQSLYIDGVYYAMTLGSGQTASNGVYTYQTVLAEGSHTYSFAFADGKGGSVRLPREGSYTGPLITTAGNHAPVLTSGGVSPETGTSSTIFTYSVHYFDEDGDSPATRSVYIDDAPQTMTLLSGESANGIYGYETALAPGTHTYAFKFTDGKGGSARLPLENAYAHTTVDDKGLFVAPSPVGNDENDGSRTHPFATIRHAVAVAQGTQAAPVTIYIAAGTYRESLSLDAWESLQGGWNSDFSQRWNFRLNGVDPSSAYETIIDGGGSERCLAIKGQSGVAVDGITLQHGKSGPCTSGGGGLYIESCSPDIRYCRILNSTTAGYGGGIYVAYGSPAFTSCRVSGNHASGSENRYGGGMFNYKATPIITKCTFEANSAGCTVAAGGAVYNFTSDALIRDCIFAGNTTGGDNSYGAALYNASSNPTITNCVFWKNAAAGRCLSTGGAMYNQTANPVITNCTFYGNSASTCSAVSLGGGIYNTAASQPVITNTILWGDTAGNGDELYNEEGAVCTIAYCDIDLALYADDTLNHNMSLAPLFVDPEKGDLHLQADSPCIDRGTNAATALPENDFEGEPRIIHAVVDIGADEHL